MNIVFISLLQGRQMMGGVHWVRLHPLRKIQGESQDLLEIFLLKFSLYATRQPMGARLDSIQEQMVISHPLREKLWFRTPFGGKSGDFAPPFGKVSDSDAPVLVLCYVEICCDILHSPVQGLGIA